MIRRLVERLVARVISELPYLRLYEATIESQADDYTCDVTPDDTDVRGDGLSNVPIKHGIPGVRVRVQQGARCLLGFEGGDPDKPYVSLWSSGSVDSIELAGDSRGVVRVGDLATISWPIMSCVGTLNGAPFAATIAGGSVTTATVATGSDKVTAG